MRFLFIVIFLPLITFCQDNDKKVFILKPSFGLNACQIHGDNYSGYDKAGLFGGIAVNARIKTRSSFELGFYFSQKGSRKNQNPKTGDYTFYRLNLNYVDLPLSFRYELNQRYFITGGGSFAYLISYNENWDNVDMSAYSSYNKTEIGLNIGLGARLKKGFSVEVRSSNSVTPIRNYGIAATLVYYNNPIARFFNKGFYSNLITAMLTYTIEKKKKNEEQ